VADLLERLVHRVRSEVDREESARRLDAELRPRLRRYFRASGFTEPETEDLVQEALIRVFRAVGGLREEERFVPWLFVLARNLARTAGEARHREQERRAEGVDLEAVAGAVEPEPASRARARLARVQRVLGVLPEQQRRCLILVARDGLSYREAADLLGLSALTVRNHLAAARRRLRAELEGGERDEQRPPE
jgi:RNA polymerase sigma-70 factor (ECF subfamily)